MVRAFFPQSGNESIIANTNYPPQDYISGDSGGVVPPPEEGVALVQTSTLTALVQTGTLTALIQTGTG